MPLVVAIDHRISAICRALEGAAASDPEAGQTLRRDGSPASRVNAEAA
jgi:hypothetical protein